MTNDDFEVGVVHELWRYPVKSMRGEQLNEVAVGWYGLDGDRRCAFIRSDNSSGFPWLTGRQTPQMLLYTPFYTDPSNTKQSTIQVKTPTERQVSLDSEELKAELGQAYGHEVNLIRITRGIFDTLVVSVMSLATARALEEQFELPLDKDCFRQNIIIDTIDKAPFAEDSWVGAILTIGHGPDAVQIRLNERIGRCQMININPKTAAINPGVLKMVSQIRESCVGVGCSTAMTGIIKVGDVVRLQPV